MSFFAAAVPTYVGGVMAFAWASDDPSRRRVGLGLLEERFGALRLATRYYTPEIHRAAFALPRFINEAIEP